MIDYNFLVLREAVDKVFELRNKSLQSQQDATWILKYRTYVVSSMLCILYAQVQFTIYIAKLNQYIYLSKIMNHSL